jgi:predicted DNA repair protein MutK
MPATGLLALLDDITAIMDDVATMSKVAAQKTAGIAGDDLAVNAQGLVGLDPSRELPILGRVALGSVANKVVLVPLALVLPHAAITPLLMLGGTFLCYEGLHKVLHKHDHADDEHHAKLVEAVKAGPEALQQVESQKIKQAIFTDVILSAEIVAVALGAVADEPMATKASVLAVVSLGMTVAIYGLVAVIVKLDDVGLHFTQTSPQGSGKHRFGQMLLDYTPLLMRAISVLGTAAMFLVGGGIVLHGLHGVEEAIHHALDAVHHIPWLHGVLSTASTFAAGLVIGAIALVAVEAVKKVMALVRPGTSGAH